ncbi:class E sortase [Actinobaculum suis]|uniref:class E sortase n=1 Tax=Actinobaculum suis TaxID=1657 RepID=UPI0009F2B9FD|nr:class E sortase [Actinobaculum suis]
MSGRNNASGDPLGGRHAWQANASSPQGAGGPYGAGSPYDAGNPYGTGSQSGSANPYDAGDPYGTGNSYGTGNPYEGTAGSPYQNDAGSPYQSGTNNSYQNDPYQNYPYQNDPYAGGYGTGYAGQPDPYATQYAPAYTSQSGSEYRGAPAPQTQPASVAFADWEQDTSFDYGAPAHSAAVAGPAPTTPRRRGGFFSRLLGVIGEILITLGVLVGLFIFWQLYYTDLGANKDQAKQVEQAQHAWGDPNAQERIGTPRYDDPPPARHYTTEGDIEGIIYIPEFGKDWAYTIKYGVDLENIIDTGSFGHYPETQYVGEVGNYAITAHRQTYGAAMRDVDKMREGDSIIVQTEDAYYVYKMVGSDIVQPTATEVLSPNPGHPELPAEKRMMTITTCHPPYVSNERWIVYAQFDHWVDPHDGKPEELVKGK